MASYAKQMLEAATLWLTANPDASAATLRVPDERGDRYYTELRKRVDVAIAQYAKTPPNAELADQIAHVERMIEEMKAGEAQVRQTEADLVAAISSTVPIKEKHQIDTGEARMDLGTWLLAWGRSGFNAFDLSPDFTAAMLLTDPSALDIAAARMPFPGLLVTIPSGFALGVEGLPYTKIHVWEAAGSLSIHANDGVHGFVTIVPLHDLAWAVVEDLPDSDDDVDRRARRTILQIVFGLLAYTSAVEGALTRREPERRKPKRASRSPQPAAPGVVQWEVGRDVHLDPRLVQAARGGSREIALRIKHRFIVRGHYRMQAHGPARSLRTARWIAPFWKGPEEGAKIIHTYKPKLTAA